jgi:hypothetical protein
MINIPMTTQRNCCWRSLFWLLSSACFAAAGIPQSPAAVLVSPRVSFAQEFERSTEAKARVALDPSERENLRFVIFLQEQKSLHIVGAAASTLPH